MKGNEPVTSSSFPYPDVQVPEQNRQVNPRGLQMELMNLDTRDVWLSCAPVTREFFTSLTVAPPWIKLGAANGAMDAAWFRRSPGAEADGPLDIREFEGHRFMRVARPRKPLPSKIQGGPMLLTVHKHHSVSFDPGTTLRILENPAGERFVEASRGGGAADPSLLKLEEGMRISEFKLSKPWTVDIPAPATVYFFPTIDVFHGPVGEIPSE